MQAERSHTQRQLGRLVLGVGVFLIVWSAVLNPAVVAHFSGEDGLSAEALRDTAVSRVVLAIVGISLAAAGLAVLWMRGPAALLESRRLVRVILLALFLALPLLVLERTLAPFIEQRTTIFVRDSVLGWKLKPLAQDFWGGVPVRINSRGLRGPERAYEKPAGTTRILFLGDSVTFGFRLPRDEDTVPARVEADLARSLARPVECINGAVDGYSSWQEREFLTREGVRYAPDLVVVGFVLNDVDERFGLTAFGGSGEGFQLERSLSESWIRLFESCNIVRFADRLRGRMRFGSDAQDGARQQELLDTYAIMFHPNRDDVQKAWKATLKDLESLVEACRERNLPVLLVVFPYATQLYQPELNSPQWILERFAGRREIPFLDLQPPFLTAVKEGGISIDDLFLDPIHPKERGNEIAARAITDAILQRKLLP